MLNNSRERLFERSDNILSYRETIPRFEPAIKVGDRFGVRRGITLLNFHTNVSKSSRELRFSFTNKMYTKMTSLIAAISEIISLKINQ